MIQLIIFILFCVYLYKMFDMNEKRRQLLEKKLEYLIILETKDESEENKTKARVYMTELEKQARSKLLIMIFNPISLAVYMAIIIVSYLVLTMN